MRNKKWQVWTKSSSKLLFDWFKPNDGIKKSKNWFGLVWFYGVSNIVDYLMPNPAYTYISNRSNM